MSKNRNRIFLSLVATLIGMHSAVFAVSFSDALDQMKTDAFSMGDLFEGKTVVKNVYSQALKLAKDREISSTTVSFDYLKSYYAKCPALQTDDFINVLYNSNFSFKETFKQILPAGTKQPTSREIDQSYQRFLDCKGWTRTAEYISSISTEVNQQYYAGYSNAYALNALNQDNYGSDLYRNGTLDDSSFDLLYDINQVGNILFEEFKESPQILFYRLPTLQSVTTRAGGDLASLSDQSSYQVGGALASSSSSSSASSDSVSPNDGSSDTSSSDVQTRDLPLATDDKEIQQFITSTDDSSLLSSASSALLLGNACLSSGTSETGISSGTSAEPLATPQEYISGIATFITTANTNTTITDHLLSVFKDQIGSGETSSGDIGNTYAEQAFGDAQPGTCEYSCNTLSLDEQVKCQLNCAKSCIKSCDDVSGIQNKALCVSDCTCFLVSGPNGKGRQKIEDMFRISFCKVPSETKRIMPGKTVYSIQAIFQEISDVLEGLRDSGQMVKFSKTKEYLDGNIKIKLADNFAFQVQIGLKPVFPQVSTTINAQEYSQTDKELASRILDMNVSAPEADDYNKYLIISDPAKNKANLQYATSLTDINANIDAFSQTISSSVAMSDQTAQIMRKTSEHDLNVLFMQNIIQFLQDNYSFRNNFAQTLLDMDQMSLDLRTKVEGSN